MSWWDGDVELGGGGGGGGGGNSAADALTDSGGDGSSAGGSGGWGAITGSGDSNFNDDANSGAAQDQLANAVEGYQPGGGANAPDAYVGNFIDNLFGTSPDKYAAQQAAIANDTGGYDMPVGDSTYYTPRGPWSATDAAKGALGGYALNMVSPGFGFVNGATNAVPGMAHFLGANVSDMTPVGFARMDREASAQRASDQSAGRGDYAPVNDSPELLPTANAQRLADGLDTNAPTGTPAYGGGVAGKGKKWNLTDFTGGYGV